MIKYFKKAFLCVPCVSSERSERVRYSTMRYILFVLLLITLFFFSSPSAHGFYQWEGEDSYLELRGMLRLYGNAYRTPGNDIFFKDREKAGLAGLARLIAEGRIGEKLHINFNAYQTYIPAHMVSMQAGMGTVLDVERSSLTEWSLSNKDYAHTAVDSLNLRLSMGRVDLILGRQPVNLATTFFFSPNDFFAPFAAQAFYRTYKPGVDAVRAEIRLGNFSQLSLISVLGYSANRSGITGWSDFPADERASYLARISSVFNNFELAFIGGKVRKNTVIGGALQGEIFSRIGVRAEGNITHPDDNSKGSHLKLSVGIDRHFANSLDLRMEYYYQGDGTDKPAEYIAMLSREDSGSYSGRNYLAIGSGYEFTPLFRGDISFIGNMEDYSGICSLYGVYSLSNETDLSFNLGIPFGKKPEGLLIESEFGMYPYSFTLEIRHYF